MSKSSAAAILTLGICIGLIFGIWGFSLFRPVKEVEIAPKAPENAFYVDYLRSLNYTVTEKGLYVNDYQSVKNINEFLWILKAGNITEC